MKVKVLQEFKEFAVKGNVIDLAVGIIIGASFGKIAASLVNDVLMPPISTYLLRGVDFSDRFVVLRGSVPGNQTVANAKAAGATTVNYGLFVNAIIEFIIVAFAVFLLVKQINRLRRRGDVHEPNTRACPECLTDVPKLATRCKACTAGLPLA